MNRNKRTSQRGVALLVLLSILVLALATALVARVSLNQRQSERIQGNSQVLQTAAENLLGFALRQIPPGTLPCPDTNGDGQQNTTAGGCQSQRGLLPVRTLNSPSLTDSSGAKLWYAVETNLVANAVGARNPSRTTSLQLDGVAMAAMVIAPGEPVQGQGRAPLAVADFLEGSNADASLNIYARPLDDRGNDQILGLELGDFWSAMAPRALAQALALLENYRAVCGEYPWAAVFGGPYSSVNLQQVGSLPLSGALPFNWGALCAGGPAPVVPGWLTTHWRDQIYYRMCTSAEGSCIATVGNTNPAASALVLAPGIPLAGQGRPSSSVANYFELENSGAPDNVFRDQDAIDHSGSYNDVTRFISP